MKYGWVPGEVARLVGTGELGGVTYSPLGRVTTGAAPAFLRQKPGAAARAQLEAAPGPGPGHVLPGSRFRMPELPVPSRLGAALGPVSRGGANAFPRWDGAVEALEKRGIRTRAPVPAVKARSQEGGIAYYKRWTWSPSGYRGTFRP